MMDKLPAIYNSSFPIAVLLVVFNCVWREALNLCFVDAENIFSHLELINEIKAPSIIDFQQRRVASILNNLVYKSVLINSKCEVCCCSLQLQIELFVHIVS